MLCAMHDWTGWTKYLFSPKMLPFFRTQMSYVNIVVGSKVDFPFYWQIVERSRPSGHVALLWFEHGHNQAENKITIFSLCVNLCTRPAPKPDQIKFSYLYRYLYIYVQERVDTHLYHFAEARTTNRERTAKANGEEKNIENHSSVLILKICYCFSIKVMRSHTHTWYFIYIVSAWMIIHIFLCMATIDAPVNCYLTLSAVHFSRKK